MGTVWVGRSGRCVKAGCCRHGKQIQTGERDPGIKCESCAVAIDFIKNNDPTNRCLKPTVGNGSDCLCGVGERCNGCECLGAGPRHGLWKGEKYQKSER